MSLERFRKRFNAARAAVDPQTGRLTSEFSQLIDELLRSVDSNAVTANEDIAAVGTGGVYGVSTAFIWNTDPSGVYPAGNPTRDLVVPFYDVDGNQIATRTLRGTLTSSSGLIAVTPVSTTGDATTYALIDDGTASVRADVTHTDSGAINSLSWSSVDISTAGGTPASGGGK